MKKMYKWSVLAAATLGLVACGAGGQKTSSQQSKMEKTAKNVVSDGQMELRLKGGQYIKPPVLHESEDGTYLALQLEFKNLTKDSVNVSDSDVTIYDADNNKVQLTTGIYDKSEAFQLLKSDQLAQDKKLTGYVVFPVEKGKTYELQYERKTYSSDKKSKPLKIAIDSSKYEDKVEASTLLADEYIDQVFFSGQRKIKKDADFVLGTDLKKERSNFRAKFAADFTRKLHDYQFPEEEVTQFIDAYEKENAKRAKLTYKVKQYLPEKVVISLNPETVSMEKTILNHMQTFYQEHRKDYSSIIEANQAQNKAYREEMMASLADRPLTTPDRYEYQMTFVKKDGKWEVEKSYNSDSFMEKFEGNL